MPWFKKKPIPIEARQVTSPNAAELAEWCGGNLTYLADEVCCIVIPTLEGPMRANLNDWIIRGVQGEFYPCKPDIFRDTYDQVGS